jgi:hypothetical protein
MINWKGIERGHSLNEVLPNQVPGQREETLKTLVIIARNGTKILSRHLLNTTPQCYHYNLLGKDFLNFDLGTL